MQTATSACRHVFDEVLTNSNEIWKYEVWALARDFDDKPCLPPPLNVVHVSLYLISAGIAHKRPRLLRCCCRRA